MEGSQLLSCAKHTVYRGSKDAKKDKLQHSNRKSQLQGEVLVSTNSNVAPELHNTTTTCDTALKLDPDSDTTEHRKTHVHKS